ncbi:hypothetical protein [Thiohalophilus sp.]|uniref:hypothetical protein n=1 Tax=Thiohalophilus sp. TaxID=3028392 RepID=UPI002ACE7C05|nr:hypothetical protein [Thiohalophilus sp.]MDZ7662171.1 hypothetical protein [Thiohalophilus sp.]
MTDSRTPSGRHASLYRYQALSPIDQPQVHIRFAGTFEGNEVIWDARLHTLRYEYEQSRLQQVLPPATFRQYIYIHPAQGERLPITVALNVPQFDEPAILKTIIMIHNYKRLRFGRHEFGQPVSFSS